MKLGGFFIILAFHLTLVEARRSHAQSEGRHRGWMAVEGTQGEKEKEETEKDPNPDTEADQAKKSLPAKEAVEKLSSQLEDVALDNGKEFNLPEKKAEYLIQKLSPEEQKAVLDHLLKDEEGKLKKLDESRSKVRLAMSLGTDTEQMRKALFEEQKKVAAAITLRKMLQNLDKSRRAGDKYDWLKEGLDQRRLASLTPEELREAYQTLQFSRAKIEGDSRSLAGEESARIARAQSGLIKELRHRLTPEFFKERGESPEEFKKSFPKFVFESELGLSGPQPRDLTDQSSSELRSTLGTNNLDRLRQAESAMKGYKDVALSFFGAGNLDHSPIEGTYRGVFSEIEKLRVERNNEIASQLEGVSYSPEKGFNFGRKSFTAGSLSERELVFYGELQPGLDQALQDPLRQEPVRFEDTVFLPPQKSDGDPKNPSTAGSWRVPKYKPGEFSALTVEDYKDEVKGALLELQRDVKHFNEVSAQMRTSGDRAMEAWAAPWDPEVKYFVDRNDARLTRALELVRDQREFLTLRLGVREDLINGSLSAFQAVERDRAGISEAQRALEREAANKASLIASVIPVVGAVRATATAGKALSLAQRAYIAAGQFFLGGIGGGVAYTIDRNARIADGALDEFSYKELGEVSALSALLAPIVGSGKIPKNYLAGAGAYGTTERIFAAEKKHSEGLKYSTVANLAEAALSLYGTYQTARPPKVPKGTVASASPAREPLEFVPVPAKGFPNEPASAPATAGIPAVTPSRPNRVPAGHSPGAGARSTPDLPEGTVGAGAKPLPGESELSLTGTGQKASSPTAKVTPEISKNQTEIDRLSKELDGQATSLDDYKQVLSEAQQAQARLADLRQQVLQRYPEPSNLQRRQLGLIDEQAESLARVVQRASQGLAKTTPPTAEITLAPANSRQGGRLIEDERVLANAPDPKVANLYKDLRSLRVGIKTIEELPDSAAEGRPRLERYAAKLETKLSELKARVSSEPRLPSLRAEEIKDIEAAQAELGRLTKRLRGELAPTTAQATPKSIGGQPSAAAETAEDLDFLLSQALNRIEEKGLKPIRKGVDGLQAEPGVPARNKAAQKQLGELAAQEDEKLNALAAEVQSAFPKDSPLRRKQLEAIQAKRNELEGLKKSLYETPPPTEGLPQVNEIYPKEIVERTNRVAEYLEGVRKEPVSAKERLIIAERTTEIPAVAKDRGDISALEAQGYLDDAGVLISGANGGANKIQGERLHRTLNQVLKSEGGLEKLRSMPREERISTITKALQRINKGDPVDPVVQKRFVEATADLVAASHEIQHARYQSVQSPSGDVRTNVPSREQLQALVDKPGNGGLFSTGTTDEEVTHFFPNKPDAPNRQSEIIIFEYPPGTQGVVINGNGDVAKTARLLQGAAAGFVPNEIMLSAPPNGFQVVGAPQLKQYGPDTFALIVKVAPRK